MVSKKRNVVLTNMLINTVYIIICLVCAVPLITVISISMSNERILITEGYGIIPSLFDFSAYKYIFTNFNGILHAYSISIFVAGIGCILSLLVSSMFAYAISRKDFRFWRPFSLYIIFTMLFNGGIVSNYIVVSNYLKLRDSVWALILPYVVIPMYVLILRTFFSSVPGAIIESAKIDGANEFYTFFRIVIPLSKPAIAAVGLLILLLYWNDWWLGLLFISDSKKATLQLMLNWMMQNIEFLRTTALDAATQIKASDFPSESARMAMCIVAAGPMLVVFPFFQKYFVRGLTVGSIKG